MEGEARLYLITRDEFEGEGVFKKQVGRSFVALRISKDREKLASTYQDCDVIEVNDLEDHDIIVTKKEIKAIESKEV